MAERVGAVHFQREVNIKTEWEEARDFAAQKTLEKKRKKCAPC